MTRSDTSVSSITIDDLTIRYPARGISPAFTAVRGVTFKLSEGEVLGIVGESGSGKSTLARVCSGDGFQADPGTGTRPQIVGGAATVLGHPVRGIRRRALRRLTFEVGLLAQNAADLLPPTLTVAEVVAVPILERDARYNRTVLGTRVATMIDAVRLPLTVLGKYPYELSTGQRQRVALARALVCEPTLLIADEPTAGVDVVVRDAVIDLIGELRRDRAFSALVISNDLAVLRRVADRVGVMHQGVLVGLGTIEEVFGDPWHPYVAQLALTDQTEKLPMFETDPGVGEGDKND